MSPRRSCAPCTCASLAKCQPVIQQYNQRHTQKRHQEARTHTKRHQRAHIHTQKSHQRRHTSRNASKQRGRAQAGGGKFILRARVGSAEDLVIDKWPFQPGESKISPPSLIPDFFLWYQRRGCRRPTQRTYSEKT